MAGNAVSTRDRKRVARMAGKGSCESVRECLLGECKSLAIDRGECAGMCAGDCKLIEIIHGMGIANKSVFTSWHDKCSKCKKDLSKKES